MIIMIIMIIMIMIIMMIMMIMIIMIIITIIMMIIIIMIRIIMIIIMISVRALPNQAYHPVTIVGSSFVSGAFRNGLALGIPKKKMPKRIIKGW